MPLDFSVDLTTEVVRTERLVLRPYRPDDVDAVLRACQDPLIQRGINALPHPYTEEVARNWVCEQAPRERAEGRGMPTVVESAGELVGSSGVHLAHNRLGPEIGYWIAPEARGHGYAAEAARGLAEWALRLGAPRVHLYADVGNTASQATARKAGFTQEGVVRSCLEYRDGTRGDAVLFGRLRGD
ncbi:MAG: GNAT family N-acetyltransferase [Actinomycetota bacterium]|nr:GNAT family N-acetyltransferase [Actinomycetota bacterium]